MLEDGQGIRGAARLFGAPSARVSDAVYGRVSTNCTKPGPRPTVRKIEEATFSEHVKYMSAIGCGYPRSDVMMPGFSVFNQHGQKRTRKANMREVVLQLSKDMNGVENS